MKKIIIIVLIAIGSLWLAFRGPGRVVDPSNSLIIYTSRNSELIDPVLAAFTEETGIAVNYRSDKANALLERLKVESDRSPADILITVDVGNLVSAARSGVLKSLTPDQVQVLKHRIHKSLRDTKHRWFGFSLRARPIFYHPQRVQPSELGDYKDLALPKWKGRLCLRTSKKVYTQSLVASLLHHLSLSNTTHVLKGWMKNLAAPVFHSDTKLLEAIAAGQCDVGIANSYYFGRLLKKNSNFPVKLFWPNQKTTGVHLNISGAGILKSSSKPQLALKFLNWLSTPRAQKVFAHVNMEYPAVESVEPDELVQSWGNLIS